MFAALVAASTAFVGCSSDEDLAQVPEIIDEEPAGVPMVFTAIDGSDPATRGVDITTSTLGDFKLFSDLSGWGTGIEFGSSYNSTTEKAVCSPKSATNKLTWPDSDTHTFFAVSDYAHFTSDPTYSSSFSFSYTIPTTYADQKDLLVATATGSKSANDGNVDLPFKHALAKIQAIELYANVEKLVRRGFRDANVYRFRINGARIGGIYASGTYTFGSGWETTGGTDKVFEIPLKESELTFDKMSFTPNEDKSVRLSLPLTDDGFYMIPQVGTGDFDDNPPGGGNWGVKGAYIELDAQVFVYESATSMDPDEDMGWYHCCEDISVLYFNETSSDEAGYGKIRVPLKFSKLSDGTGYTLVIDLGNGVIYDDGGTDAFTMDPIFVGTDFKVS